MTRNPVEPDPLEAALESLQRGLGGSRINASVRGSILPLLSQHEAALVALGVELALETIRNERSRPGGQGTL
jgi:hypothetical protein